MESSAATQDPSLPRRPLLPKALAGVLVLAGLAALRLKGFIVLLAEKVRLLLVNPFEGFGATQYAIAAGSMALTVAAYATSFRLGLVIGFVLITVIHEIGHAVVMRKKGLRVGFMVFIPFIGGAVTLKDQPRSAYDDAQIGLAGPIAGTLASLASLAIWKSTANPLYLLIAFVGFGINLVNLLPIGMLDGGRISAAVTKWMWVFGGGVLVYKVVKQPNPLLIAILLLAAFQVYASIMREKEDHFYEVTPGQRAAIAVVYFSLVLFLGHQTFLAYDRIQSLVLGP
ncbi:MAG TPA: site-2 protease family protein [Thermoanaerobaculia bacterium]|nr:site-2 protease family protein [Thermoanaerobaculia bacterium]